MVEFTRDNTGAEIVSALATHTAGKTILITGPSKDSLGAQVALDLALGKPKRIILAGRNRDKIQPVIDELHKSSPDVETTFVKVDLANQASIREAAKEINSQIDVLDILVNSAGVMAVKDYTLTADGIEYHFGLGHIGHFLLTNLLIDKLLASKDGARILNVTSFGYLPGGVRFDDWNFKDGKEYNPWYGYSQAKTANILFSGALARRLGKKGIISFAVDPGFVPGTRLQDNVTPELFQEGYVITQSTLNGIPMPDMRPRSIPEASGTYVYGALDPSLKSHNGALLAQTEVYTGPLKDHALGQENQDKLWELSEKLVNQKFAYN